MEKKRKTQLYSLIVILCILVPIEFLNVSEHREQERIRVCNEMQSHILLTAFDPLIQTVRARSFFVEDLTKHQSIYGKDSDTPRPLASLTKLMTLRLALSHESPSAYYTIKHGDLDSDGFVGFVIGDTYRIEDLIKAALIASSNDSAVMLARSTGLSDSDFVVAMNYEAKNLGLDTLSYGNPTGLDSNNDTVATAFGSAKDVLSLLYDDYTEYPAIVSFGTKKTETISATNGRSIALTNTDLAIDNLPFLLASKTGYTDVAGGNLAILWTAQNNDIFGASVLGSTESGRFEDMTAIYRATGAYESALLALPESCKK